MAMIDKQRTVTVIRERMDAWYKGNNIKAACLYWAGMVIDEMTNRRGVRTILQAGTLQWPIVTPEQDDGVSATHFSYMWEPHTHTTRLRMAQGLLPEMHVWAAIPSQGEIIDVTTCYLVEQARERAGLIWKAPPPPDFLWCGAEGLPEGVHYAPDREATIFAAQLLARTA